MKKYSAIALLVLAWTAEVESMPIRLTVALDDYPGEIQWALNTYEGEEVACRKYNDLVAPQDVFQYLYPVYPGPYTFTMDDTEGDGLCCSYGDGWYMIEIPGRTTLVDNDGQFGYQSTSVFYVPEATCGDGYVGNGICPYGQCCSIWGWCGYDDEWCDNKATVVATCGNGIVGNGICSDFTCCSADGWCGTDDASCLDLAPQSPGHTNPSNAVNATGDEQTEADLFGEPLATTADDAKGGTGPNPGPGPGPTPGHTTLAPDVDGEPDAKGGTGPNPGPGPGPTPGHTTLAPDVDSEQEAADTANLDVKPAKDVFGLDEPGAAKTEEIEIARDGARRRYLR